MFHQPAFFSPARVLTPPDYGWDEERDHSFARFRAGGLVPGRADARLRAERERPEKDIARLRGAINRSSPRKA